MELIYRYDPFQPVVLDSPHDVEAAQAKLIAGNERFVRFVAQMQAATIGESASQQRVVPIDLVSMGLPLLPGVALDQRPFALVLGCSDARVPVEGVLDQNFNDLFVLRIAGNVLGTECLGSFDYAIRAFHESLKLVVVLGHSGCGAVTAAVDAYLNPTAYADIAFTHSLRTLVDRIMIAVRMAARGLEQCGGVAVREHPGYRTALIESAVYLNAAINSFDLRREGQIIRKLPLEFRFGVCDLRSLLVRDAPPQASDGDNADQPRLGPAPRDAGDFLELGILFARCVMASGLLD